MMASFTCPTCQGSGKVVEYFATSTESGQRKVKCSKCEGTGKVNNQGYSVRW